MLAPWLKVSNVEKKWNKYFYQFINYNIGEIRNYYCIWFFCEGIRGSEYAGLAIHYIPLNEIEIVSNTDILLAYFKIIYL